MFPQYKGLLGSQGLFPIEDFVNSLSTNYSLFERIWLAPSIFWISHSNTMLLLTIIIGTSASIVALYKPLRSAALLLCWLSYLSISSMGGPFFEFQWDSLLLEAGFIAIFLSAGLNRGIASISKTALFLQHWLIFRLVFSSGVAKLLSGDPNWRNLTALFYHFETQPLPTPLAYYIDKLPAIYLNALCLCVLVIEVVIPFFIFASANLRRGAGLVIIFFQIIIILTGSFGFFNLLTIALCVALFDDELLSKAKLKPTYIAKASLCSFWGLVVFVISFVPLANLVIPSSSLPLVSTLYTWTNTFQIVNSYGLFSFMTTERLAVVLEGSHDGEYWEEIPYRWHPQEVSSNLRFIAPYHPRLDWQIWFAQFRPPQRTPWFQQLVGGLLANSESIWSLLDREKIYLKPKYIRALLYRYEFTKRHDRKILGQVWQRTLLGIYLHPVKKKEK